MEKLLNHLNQIELSHSGQKASSLLSELTKSAREKSGEPGAAKLVEEWLFPKNDAVSHASFNILKALQLVPGEISEAAALQQAMVELSQHDESPIKPSIMEAIKELLRSNRSGNRQTFILNLAKLNSEIGRNQSSGSPLQLVSQIQRIMIKTRAGQLSCPAEEKIILPIIKGALLLTRNHIADELRPRLPFIFSETELKQASVKLGSLLAGENSALDARLQPQEGALLADLKNISEAGSLFRYDQQSIKSQLKYLIQSLGLSYEHEMAIFLKQPNDDAGELSTLKPLLIGLLNEEMPHSVEDAAERLLHKITGFQALSQEAGPQQHLVFQLPIALGGKVTDLTMQWSGRKTDKGQIDPSYCRVLFYLNLEHLNETVVDFHVQNRVIKISVINEHETLKALAAPLIEKLKENLNELNYKLSSVFF